jgi:hypothetical protein
LDGNYILLAKREILHINFEELRRCFIARLKRVGALKVDKKSRT